MAESPFAFQVIWSFTQSPRIQPTFGRCAFGNILRRISLTFKAMVTDSYPGRGDFIFLTPARDYLGEFHRESVPNAQEEVSPWG